MANPYTVTPQVEEVAPGLYAVAIPIPIPLKFINCYAARGPEGWTLVDCGFHDAGGEAAWRAAFAQLGIGPGDVERIVVTHLHPDHLGAAGWLQTLTGAPVLLHRPEAEKVPTVWDPAGRQGEAVAALFAAHGMPAERALGIDEHHRQQVRRVLPLPQVTPVDEGQEVPIGHRRWQVLHTPGHSDGHMVLWCPDDSLLLAGDAVLAKITPNVPLWPRLDPDPLGSFLASLEKLGRLPARLALPGHRTPIAHLAGRCAEIAHHHQERLARVQHLVAQAGPGGATGWEVCLGLFGDYEHPQQMRFAMAETLAHLEYLALRGHLVRDEGQPIRYRVPA